MVVRTRMRNVRFTCRLFVAEGCCARRFSDLRTEESATFSTNDRRYGTQMAEFRARNVFGSKFRDQVSFEDGCCSRFLSCGVIIVVVEREESLSGFLSYIVLLSVARRVDIRFFRGAQVFHSSLQR